MTKHANAVVRPAEAVGGSAAHLIDGVEVRLVLPSDAFSSSRPDYYSQRNCDLLGLTVRQFLELIRRSDAPAVACVGKLRLVRRDAMIAFIDRIARVRDGVEARSTVLDGADEVLREIGCVPARRAR